jgi:cell division transport system ATP-binding protein
MVIAPDFNTGPVIRFAHVWKTYPNGTDALRDVCLTVRDGEFLFLVGPSGAGKTSLVRLLIREERPTRGRVFVHGVDVDTMPRSRLPKFRRTVGMVFQDFKLLPRLTAQENVMFALRVLGRSSRVVKRRSAQTLEQVGLGGLGRKYPRELSGGEQQRVAIARALVHRPRLIVADEPTGNLDPATGWEITQLLLGINADGPTVVMATHNRDIVDRVRRRVVAIERGVVVRDALSGTYDVDLAEPPVRVL